MEYFLGVLFFFLVFIVLCILVMIKYGNEGLISLLSLRLTLRSQTVYKKLYYTDNRSYGYVIAELTLPIFALVHVGSKDNGRDRKCRASRLRVNKMYSYDEHGMPTYKVTTVARSGHDKTFLYEVGKVVRPHKGFSLVGGECASGVHYFHTLGKARSW